MQNFCADRFHISKFSLRHYDLLVLVKINKDGGRAEDADVVFRTEKLLRIDCFYPGFETSKSKYICV